ncbi:MAG: hypothetical protein WB561_13505 [Terracidiphilus sp.]
MRRFACSIVIGMMALCALESAAQTPPQPPSGIDAVMAYAGTWKVHGEHFLTAYSQAGKEDKTLRNDCWKSGAYIACNQYVDGDSKVLLVFTYDDKQKMYTTYQVPQGGEALGSGKLQIEGNIWIFPWQVTQGETTIYFHVVNVFTGTDHIDYAQEFSTDNVHWNTMAKGSETRVSN